MRLARPLFSFILGWVPVPIEKKKYWSGYARLGFKQLREDLVLPDLHGELSKTLSTSAIEEANINKEVKDLFVTEKG